MKLQAQRLRPPEKAKKASRTLPREPKWIGRKKVKGSAYFETRRLAT